MKLITALSKIYRVNKDDILSESRVPPLPEARRLGMWYLISKCEMKALDASNAFNRSSPVGLKAVSYVNNLYGFDKMVTTNCDKLLQKMRT
jgi:chromosomal replication initiation ATPase DnaA